MKIELPGGLDISRMPLESLRSFVADAMKEGILSRMKHGGFAIYVKKGNPRLYCVTVKEILRKSLEQVFGDDKKTKDLCLRIPEFLRKLKEEEKDIANLSPTDNDELNTIRQKALAAIKENYPELDKTFAGLQLAENADGIIVNIKKETIHKFLDIQGLIDKVREEDARLRKSRQQA